MSKINIEEIRLGHSPLTDTIFAGKLNAKGSQWLSKKDVTNDFISCVIQRWENKEEIISSDNSRWEITVRRKK